MRENYHSQHESGKIDSSHKAKRNTLRGAGLVVLGIGIIFMIVGAVDFFSAFGGGGSPKLFWCFFIGMPLMFFGSVLTGAGFMGAVGRYTSAESAPVLKDTFNYMADGTAEGVKTLATAVGEGLSSALGGVAGDATGIEEAGVRCPKCNEVNDADAKFCDECGFSLQKTIACPSCGEMNDPDAKFCDNCGKSF